MQVVAAWSAFDGAITVAAGDVVIVSHFDTTGHWAYATCGEVGGWLPSQLLKPKTFTVRIAHPSNGTEGRLSLEVGNEVLVYYRGPHGWTYGSVVSDPGWFPDACL